MSSEAATALASTIQSASLNRAPSPSHDLNPSTAASQKVPAELHSPPPSSSSSSHQQPARRSPSITSSILSPADQPTLHPRPRRLRPRTFPPLPDFRFEQSYLASLKAANNSRGRVAWITLRDQVLMPLLQGWAWNLGIYGWRYWNRGVKFSGYGVGARVRRWWWGVNGWVVPTEREVQQGKGMGGGWGVSSLDKGLGEKVEEVSLFDTFKRWGR